MVNNLTMDTRDPTLDEYIRIGRIYTAARLSRDQLLGKAKEYQENNKYATLTRGFLSYLRSEFNLPIRFWPEILQLGRQLSPLEVEALFLKEKVQKEAKQTIHISIDGIE